MVVKEYKQLRDYDETYALVARIKNVHVFLEIVAQYRWKVCQGDTNFSLLNKGLKEDLALFKYFFLDRSKKMHNGIIIF